MTYFCKTTRGQVLDLKYECGDATVDGDKATVQIKINGQSTPMTLIKVDGKWRIEKFDFPII